MGRRVPVREAGWEVSAARCRAGRRSSRGSAAASAIFRPRPWSGAAGAGRGPPAGTEGSRAGAPGAAARAEPGPSAAAGPPSGLCSRAGPGSGSRAPVLFTAQVSVGGFAPGSQSRLFLLLLMLLFLKIVVLSALGSEWRSGCGCFEHRAGKF